MIKTVIKNNVERVDIEIDEGLGIFTLNRYSIACTLQSMRVLKVKGEHEM